MGEWFDKDFDFIGAEGDAFVEALLARIELVEHRKRKRRAVDTVSHRTLVRKLAANGFHAFRMLNPSLVAVQFGPHAYQGRAEWLNGQAMRREIHLLKKAEVIEVNIGEWGVASTIFRVTNKFLIEAALARLSYENVAHRRAPDRLIRVYLTNSKDGELVYPEQDDICSQWVARLDAYNGFVADQDIGMDLSKAQSTRLTWAMNAKRRLGTPRLKYPDLIHKSLFRQFNNGSFEAGGRLYGAWWINCPKELRPLITINRERTVELDFSGCAIRMLYHENGKKCGGDPYFLNRIDACERATGLPQGFFREDVKRMTQD